MTREHTGLLVPADVAAWQAKRRVDAPHVIYADRHYYGIGLEGGRPPRGHRVRRARDVEGDRWQRWTEMVEGVAA